MSCPPEYEPFTVEVPASFEGRFASVLKPATVRHAPADMQPHYACLFPAASLPPGAEEWLGGTFAGEWKPNVRERNGVLSAMAKSHVPPMVFPGHGGTWQEMEALERLYWACDQHNLPRDFVFRDRALKLAVKPWEYRRAGPYRVEGIALNLAAVQVLDLPLGPDAWARDPLKRIIDEKAALLRAWQEEDEGHAERLALQAR